MNYLELNDYLREQFNKLVEKGHKKTVIGKLLLGANGYAPILKFLENTEDSIHFGVKPLTRIGEIIDYELKLVYVKKENTELIEKITEQNIEFGEAINEAIDEYLNSDRALPNRRNTKNTRRRKSTFDFAVNDILSDIMSEIESDAPELE